MNNQRRFQFSAIVIITVICIFIWVISPLFKQSKLDRDLLTAVKNNDTASVEYLLKKRANPNCKDAPEIRRGLRVIVLEITHRIPPLPKSGLSVLTVALNDQGNVRNRKHFELVKALVEAGANLNPNMHEEVSPLLQAVCNGRTDVVTLLLDHRANPNIKDFYGDSLLSHAVQNKFINIVTILLNQGVNVNQIDSEGYSPILRAARFGDTPLLRLLLSRGANPNDKTKDGRTALVMAARYPSTVQALIEAGADVNLKSGAMEAPAFEGNTPFMVAAYKGQLKSMGILLKHGADINAKNAKGLTALALLRWESRNATPNDSDTYYKPGWTKSIEFLKKAGAKE